MAITKVIDVKVKDKQAVKAMKSIGDAVVDTKNDIINLERELLKLQNRLAKSNARDVKGRKRLNTLIDKTKRSIKQEKNALKSLTLQKSIADKATKRQIRSNRKLNQSYFQSKKSMTDVNRLTAEMALKVTAVRNIFLGAVGAVKKFATAQRIAFTAGAIGLFIIALTVIVTFWREISELVTGTNRRLRKQIELSKERVEIINSELKVLKAREDLFIAEGKSVKLILKDRRKLLKVLLGESILQAHKLVILLEEEKATSRILDLNQRMARQELLRQGIDLGTDGTTTKELEKQVELQKKLDLANEASLKIKKLIFELDNPEAGKEPKDTTKRPKDLKALEFEEFGVKKDPFKDAELFFLIKRNILIAKENEKRKATDLLAFELLEEQKQAHSDAMKLIDKIEFEQKQALMFAVADGLAVVGDILGKETAQGKALAVASSLINTYAAIAGQLKAFAGIPIPGYAIAQAIVTGLAGFAAVKNILKVKVPGQSGGSGGGFSITSQQSAPSFNVVGVSGTNQLAQALSTQDQPIQTYVIGSQISSQQALDRNIIETATIG